MLERLKKLIPWKEAKKREKAFSKASRFIKQGPHEALSGPLTRSFIVKGTKKERVDIEIHKGQAFKD